MNDADKMLKANIKPFGLRMQPELKSRIEEAALSNERSMNAEVIARLEASFREDPGPLAEAAAQIEEMRSNLAAQQAQYAALLDQLRKTFDEDGEARKQRNEERMAQIQKDSEERRRWQEEESARMNKRIEEAQASARAERDRYLAIISRVEQREADLLALIKRLAPAK